MKWINHILLTFISWYLLFDSMGDSILVSMGSVLPDLFRSRRWVPLFLNRPRLPHNPIFWIPPLILIFLGVKSFYSILSIDFLPSPGTVVRLLAIGIGFHLFLDAFSNSPIFLPGGKKIALGWYQSSNSSDEDFFVLFCLSFACLIKFFITL